MEQTAEKANGSVEAKDVVTSPRKNESNSNGVASGTVTLGPRDRLEGKLIIESNLVVLGHVDGEVITTGDVTVEAGATVKARLECKNVSVRGRVEGDVNARKRLLLAGSGTLQGSVTVAKLQVEDGATFNGSIAMTAES
ncbi:MAG: bactofilin family protein [Candidatus Dormibacteria bacterium]